MIRRTGAVAALLLPLAAAASDPLAGRIAGPPQACIPIDSTGSPVILDARTIAYRVTARRLWVTHPVGPCTRLRQDSILIVDVYGGQLCRNDRFRVLSRGLSIPSGYCRFDRFIPYDKPAR